MGFVFIRKGQEGWDARTVEEAGRKTDDGLDHIIVDEKLANKLFLTATKEHAVWHDSSHMTVRLQACQHVLDEHEVGLFPGFRTPFAEARGELQGRAAVVLCVGRIG